MNHPGKFFFKIEFKTPQANPITLPAELHPIIELGIKDAGVCKLRGMAHAKGHDLADIFTVAKKKMSELKAKGGRVFCYLSAMIDKSGDYAARARQIERKGTVAAIVEQAKDRSRSCANKRFAGANGLLVRVFDGIAEIIRNGIPIGMIAGHDMATVHDDIDSGKLREVLQ